MDSGERSSYFGTNAVTLESQKPSADAMQNDAAKRAFSLQQLTEHPC
jgi:hypothetical protein